MDECKDGSKTLVSYFICFCLLWTAVVNGFHTAINLLVNRNTKKESRVFKTCFIVVAHQLRIICAHTNKQQKACIMPL